MIGLIRTGIRRRPDSALGQFAGKPKKCKICRGPILPPSQPSAVVCGLECAQVLAPLLRVKLEKAKATRERKAAAADRKATRAKLEKLKTRADWAREAQAVVNRYVRLRDAALGCASCDRPASWPGQWHASHFRSVGAAPGLRFHLWNIHKACSICNNHLSGNIAGYMPRLVKKIGAARVEWLQSQNAVNRRESEYFTRVKKVFTKKVTRLEKRMTA